VLPGDHPRLSALPWHMVNLGYHMNFLDFQLISVEPAGICFLSLRCNKCHFYKITLIWLWTATAWPNNIPFQYSSPENSPGLVLSWAPLRRMLRYREKPPNL
jgi:hypothetical protein